MAGIFAGNVSWIPGVDDFKVNYVLEGDQAANVFEGKVGDASYVFLGDSNGRDYVTKARTFEWGINSIQPDGQIATAGNMQLPVRWGLNGQLLGIAAGTVDWITPSDVSNLSVSISQLGCSAITNVDVGSNDGQADDPATQKLENLKNHYDMFHFSDDSTFEERVVWSGIAGDEVRLSTSLGLFSNARAVSSMALGWQNITSLPYSTLLGCNLELSGNQYISSQTDFSFGEVVIGVSNKKYEMRPIGTKQRVLTIGCGDLSDNSGNETRDDAMYILKDGSTHFTKDVDIHGKIDVFGDLSICGQINSYNTSYENIFRGNILLQSSDGTNTIEIDPIGDISAVRVITAKEKIKTSEIESNTGLNLDISGSGKGRFKNFTEVRFTANNDANNDTIITQIGISSEDISCSRITIGGLHFPPKINTLRDSNINEIGQEWDDTAEKWSTNYQNSKFVLTSKGDGTVEWNDLSSVAIDVSLHQLADVTVVNRDDNEYLNLGDKSDSSGIKVYNLWVSNGDDASNAIIEGSLDICKNVLIEGHLDVCGNTDISGNVDICGSVVIAGDVDISENVKIGGHVDISKNVVIDGDVDIKKNVKIEGHVDISKNVVIDGNTDISGNVDISGNLQINSNVDISKNVTIAGDVDISGTTYLNSDVILGKIEEPAKLGVTGSVDISGTVKINDDVECSGNFFFSKSATTRVQTLDFQDDRLSILGLIKTEVATAIGQSIKTPAGGILWFARDKAPDNFRVCNGQFFNRQHSVDLDNNLSNAIRQPWEYGYNGMTQIQWENKYLKNQTIDISLTSISPPKFNINAMSALTRMRINNDIANIASNQDVSLIYFTPKINSNTLNFDIKNDTVSPIDISISILDNANNLTEQVPNVNTGNMNFSMSNIQDKFALTDKLQFDISYGGQSHYIKFHVNDIDYETLIQNYIQLPDMIDKFIRGSDGVDINIGTLKTEQLRDHKHLSTNHQHDLQDITVDFSHNHDLSYNMHDMSINHHQHSIAMGYMNYSSEVISKNLESHVQIDPNTLQAVSGSNTSDISLLIHPDSIITNALKDGNVESITSRDQGGGELTIAGHTKTIETPNDIAAIPSDTNLSGNYKFISISNDEYGYDSGKHEFIFSNNTFTDASRSYVQGAYDVSNTLVESNSTRDDISPEGYPTHLTMLPCISIGIVQGAEDEGDFDYDSYTYQTRIRFLENRLDRMDKQMNTTGINIIGGLEHIQKTINPPSRWEEPTRGNIYEAFNFSGFVFNNTDISNNFYFDFTRSSFDAELANHHRVLHSGVWYDISGSPTRPYNLTDIDKVAYDTNDGSTYSGAYKVLDASNNVTIARYYQGKTDYSDISWVFTNPRR